MFTKMRARLAALVLLALAVPATSPAHEGHDHAPESLPPASSTASRLEASSELFELVAIARGAELIVYVDRFRSNEPVEGAVLEIETQEGPRVAEAIGDAYRLPAPWLAKPGRHELIFTITLGDEVEILTGALAVEAPPPASGAGPQAGSMAAVASDLRRMVGAKLTGQELSLATLTTGGIAGFVLGAATILLLRNRPRGVGAMILLLLVQMVPAAAHEGHDHGEGGAMPPPNTQAVPQRLPDGTVFVPKPTQRILAIRTAFTEIAAHPTTVELPGRIIPDPNASGYVQASVSGRLSPPPGGFPRLGTLVATGDVLAYVVPPLSAAETSDQRQRQGELDQQISIVERRIARFESLDRTRAIARAQLEDARLELLGLRDRRAALDRVRRDPEPLVAPVAGRIAAANAIAGQIAETNAIVFHIVDPARLWVEALTFAPLPAAPRRASARDAQGRTLALRHEGTGFADRNQAIAMHLSIDGSTAGLRLGQLVTVQIETQESRQGVVVPRTSVLRGQNGQQLVYEHVAAERFEPREVRVVPLDGERALVASGLERGRRVVTQGAELLNQIR